MSKTLYTYEGRDGGWCVADSPESAACDTERALYWRNGAVAFVEDDGRPGVSWRKTHPRHGRHGGVRYVATEADAVRLVAAGGPRVR